MDEDDCTPRLAPGTTHTAHTPAHGILRCHAPSRVQEAFDIDRARLLGVSEGKGCREAAACGAKKRERAERSWAEPRAVVTLTFAVVCALLAGPGAGGLLAAESGPGEIARVTISNLAVNANLVARCECDASAPGRGRYAPAPRDDVRSDAARRRPAPRVVGAAFSALRVDAHKLLLAVPAAAGGVLQADRPTDGDRVEAGAVEHAEAAPPPLLGLKDRRDALVHRRENAERRTQKLGNVQAAAERSATLAVPKLVRAMHHAAGVRSSSDNA